MPWILPGEFDLAAATVCVETVCPSRRWRLLSVPGGNEWQRHTSFASSWHTSAFQSPPALPFKETGPRLFFSWSMCIQRATRTGRVSRKK